MNDPDHTSLHSFDSQIKALIHLLSDPNERVAHTIQDRLVTIGPPAVPLLEQAGLDDPEMATRLQEVIQDIGFSEIEHAFLTLRSRPEHQDDLEVGSFLLARYRYPNLNIADYIRQLDHLAHEARIYTDAHESPQESFKALGQFLFQDKGFRGTTTDYYNPDNSFLNCVLDRKRGIPISLSVLFLLIAQRLRIPAVGIGMPGHFLVKLDPEPIFLDCFNNGAQLTQEDCERFLQESGYTVDPKFLDKSPTQLVLTRMVMNLITIYDQQNDKPRSRHLKRIVEILQKKA